MLFIIFKRHRCSTSSDKFQPLRKSNGPQCTKPHNKAKSRRRPTKSTSMDVKLVHAHAVNQRTDLKHGLVRPPCLETCPSSSLPLSSPLWSSPPLAPQQPQLHQKRVRSSSCHFHWKHRARLSEQCPSPKRTASSRQTSPRLQQHTPHQAARVSSNAAMHPTDL